MKKLIFILCILVFTMGSCKKCENPKDEHNYLMFGQFYGECLGPNCIRIFKLEPNKLYEDEKDKYPGSTNYYDGNFIPLSDDKFNISKDLQDFFPLQF